jgi:peroxiredoxin
MKHTFVTLFILISFGLNAQKAFKANPQAVPAQHPEVLKLGSKAPDFNLPATDGKYYKLADFKKKVLVVLFSCNHCPTAQAYEDRIINFTKEYGSKGVDVVVISPNSPIGILLEELGYSDLDDSFEAMKVRYSEKKYNFPYLYDGDNEAVSIQYGPVATPHVFVFDQARILKYQGRLDTIERPGKANAEDLRAAVDAVLADKEVVMKETKVFGCSTKWAWKNEFAIEKEKEWNEKIVTLDEIDVTGVKDLVANKGSEKLRLINIWATWCGPCVMEYPEFLKIHRMFGQRDFEFISISTDKIDKKEKTLKVLQQKHSNVKNYIFKEDNVYDLIENIDPKWNGALPYTILIEPNGKIIYQNQGVVEFQALKKLIVEHPMIGRYF